ncbi:toll/interleukin-1 receptor domain-containing protein [Bacillus thuringiensis]|uniref:toll/interleukin-1 receptor domain-containing protein n=1 Tax=Bacillus thuringiensis TaxID=1428 RepID=UPI00159C20F3|nr:toll/interleukin-1 receptor domain-containing protein [Bacillus thuringiensis]
MNEIEKNNDMVDFFISYNHKDEKYAEWISWILEQAGHTTIIQAWDFKPGNNFAILMHQAASHSRHTLALLSDNYLGSQFTLPEWIAAFSDDPTGERQKLIPVRIEDIKLGGLLKSILYIDLVGLDQEQAIAAILEGVQTKRKKPNTPPPFPGIIQKKTDVHDSIVEVGWYKPWIESRLKEIQFNGPYHQIKDGAKLVIHLVPIEAITTSKTYDIEELASLSLRPIYGANKEPQINKYGFCIYSKFLTNNLPHSYVQIHRDGTIEALDTGLLDGLDKYIPGVAFEQKIIMAIENYSKNAQEKLEIKLPYVINITLIDVKDHYISLDPKKPIGRITDDTLQLPPAIINSWETNIGSALKASFDYLWNDCGSVRSPNYDKDGHFKKDPNIY